MKKIFNKIICMMLFPFAGVMVSCDDWFTLLPQSEIVAEDFWKDEQDVKNSLSACYRAMIEEGFINKLIVWGEVRSDNVISGLKDDGDVKRILEVNIEASNGYAKWGEVYTVINFCNTLIEKAPAVRQLDSDFTETKLQQYIAEAKAIRAFCYFTLVRTFNRVPYIEKPYLDDTRPFEVPQSSAEEILTRLIEDLKSCEYHAMAELKDNWQHTKGRVTQKAIWALIADMALWLNDYNTCVAYCNKVLETPSNPLLLEKPEDGSIYSNDVFYIGNSEESIWELQFDQYTRNNAPKKFYGGNDENGYLSAYNLGEDETFFANNDLRSIFGYVESGKYLIKKYVAYCGYVSGNTTGVAFSFGNAEHNWILYRLPDIYLMKAEALTELGGQANLDEAVRMVSYTYDRAHPDLDEGTLIGQYVDQAEIRNLVFDERQREFMFEGKRYFDLVRRMRRNMDNLSSVIDAYLIRKYRAESLDEGTVTSKLNDKDAIYMPIHEEELRQNSLLEQNPFYATSDDIIKK